MSIGNLILKGSEVRFIREKLNLKAEDLAKALNARQGSISAMELERYPKIDLRISATDWFNFQYGHETINNLKKEFNKQQGEQDAKK